MADGERTPVEVTLVESGAIPAPDMLCVGNKGAESVDVIKFISEGSFKRGTLVMSGSEGFVACTLAGLSTAADFAVLAEDVTVGENEYTEAAAYFSGDFNENLVLIPWETEDEHHADLIDAVRDKLREHHIFLRFVGK